MYGLNEIVKLNAEHKETDSLVTQLQKEVTRCHKFMEFMQKEYPGAYHFAENHCEEP